MPWNPFTSLRPRVALTALCLLLAGIAGDDVQPLRPDAPVEREIAAGQSHSYQVAVEANRFLQVVIEQPGIDLAAGIAGGEGPPFVVNNPGERRVSEVISFLSGPPASYRIELRPVPAEAGTGRYRIRIAELRPSRAGDELRIAAERAETAADQQYSEKTAESLVRALAGYETALELWRRAGETSKEGEMLYRLGVAQRLRGDNRQALDRLDHALAIYRRSEDRAWQATVLNQQGLVLWRLGEGEKALAAFTEALAFWRTLGETETEARVLNNVGLLHHSSGRLRQAREAYVGALDIFRRTGDRKRQAAALNNLGNLHEGLGEPAEALRLQTEALALSRSLGDRGLEAEALNSLGLVRRDLGEPQAALESYHAALTIFRELGDRHREAAALNNTGSMYFELGEPDQALAPLTQAIEIQAEVGALAVEAATLSNLGRALSSLERPAEALDAFRKALELHRAAHDRSGEASTLSHLGLHQVSQGHPREALAPLDQALQIHLELGDRFGEARTRHNLGLARAALGETETAVALFEEALRLRRMIGDPVGEAAALQELARAELARGDLEAARARIEPALEIIESLRLRIASDRLRSAYFASLQEAYEIEVEILMSLHQRQPAAGLAARAFEVAERARARSLLDLLREARVELRRGAEPRLLEEERRLRVELNAKAERQTRLLERRHTEEEAAEARRDLDEALLAYEIAEGRLRAGSSAYAGLVRPETASLSAIQALLDRDTVLLEYSLGERRSFLWAVRSSGLVSFELPGRPQLETAARAAHTLLSTLDPRDGRSQREALASLGRMLLGPVAAGLTEKRLVVVAGGALQYVPFAVLTLPSGEPAVATYEVVSLPSATVLDELRHRAAGKAPFEGALAVLADPVFQPDDPRVGQPAKIAGAASPAGAPREDVLLRAAPEAGAAGFHRLPWTRSEADAAAEAAGRQVLLALDFDANLDTASSPRLLRHRVLHFATHGFLNSEHPELSGLVLSLVDPGGLPRPGFLRLPDLYNLEIGAELAVLSGCQTALGKETRGEGLMGLTRGVFFAGASQVMASLWPVRDRATAELMRRFYRAFLRDGLSAPAALRAAQLAMRQDPRWRDPYFWAPFVAQGDWRRMDAIPARPASPSE